MKYSYKLKGLDCPNCAAKIEEDVKSLAGVNAASCNAVNAALVIDAGPARFDNINAQITQIVHKYEPHVEITLQGNEKVSVNKAGEGNEGRNRIIQFIAGTIVFITALFLRDSTAGLYIFLASYLILGWKVVFRAVRNLFRGQFFDESFLMTIATSGAFAIGEYPEAVAVMLFYLIGEYFQGLAVCLSKKSIAELMDIRPDFANLKTDGNIKQVDPEIVKAGDIIIVRPGEKIPLDGIVTDGQSMLDTKALTGESAPRSVKPADTVISGCINQSGVLTIKVTKEFGESTVSKIIDLVENASGKKAPAENFITKFSRIYTPVVVGFAILLAVVPPLVFDAGWQQWIHRALVFLVISCPCALVLSIPLSFFGGIGSASRNGVLVKGGNYLEALNSLDIVVFDKTGTLTKGVFEVTGITPEAGFTEAQLLKYAAGAEAFSNHPIALSIRHAYKGSIDKDSLTDYNEIAGLGVSVSIGGVKILAGNDKLMAQSGIRCVPVSNTGTKVYISADGKYAGCITISDVIKSDSKTAIEGLKKLGVRKTVMLTGDSREIAESVAEQLSLDEVYPQLLPADKVEIVEKLDAQKRAKKKLAFVGDGINDAPVLARADVGIAMGGLGSDAAIEAADVVLMTDEPSKLITAVCIAKKTRRIVTENIVFALGVKSIFMVLGAFGISGMWEAVFADMGVSVIAVFNALRVLSNGNGKLRKRGRRYPNEKSNCIFN